MKPYDASYSVGSKVQIASIETLEHFMNTWQYHNPLKPEQLTFAGKSAIVSDVGFYHGGDPLYVLEGVAGVWHEECLERTRA